MGPRKTGISCLLLPTVKQSDKGKRIVAPGPCMIWDLSCGLSLKLITAFIFPEVGVWIFSSSHSNSRPPVHGHAYQVRFRPLDN